MLKLPQKTRVLLADKFADTANLALAALVLGQGLSERVSVVTTAVGMVLWVLFLGLALWREWDDQ